MAAMKASEAFKAAPPEQQRQALEQARIHNSGSLLNEERLGQCRVELLTQPVLAQQPGQPPQLMGTISFYPQSIPATMPCCGKFQRRPEAAAEALT